MKGGMSMVIVLPNKRIVECKEVIAVIENSFVFNGKKGVMSEEVTRSDVQPNALRFFYGEAVTTFMGCNDTSRAGFTIGNLTPYMLDTIINEIKTNNMYDFSKHVFQKKKSAFDYERSSEGTEALYMYPNNETFMLSNNLSGLHTLDELGYCSDEEYDDSEECYEHPFTDCE